MFQRNDLMLSDGDALTVRNLQEGSLTVSGYDGTQTVSSSGLEISVDGTDWATSLTLDFTDVMGIDILIRPDGASGTITVDA